MVCVWSCCFAYYKLIRPFRVARSLPFVASSRWNIPSGKMKDLATGFLKLNFYKRKTLKEFNK